MTKQINPVYIAIGINISKRHFFVMAVDADKYKAKEKAIERKNSDLFKDLPKIHSIKIFNLVDTKLMVKEAQDWFSESGLLGIDNIQALQSFHGLIKDTLKQAMK